MKTMASNKEERLLDRKLHCTVAFIAFPFIFFIVFKPQIRCILSKVLQMFFLLKKVLFSGSAFQALTKQATKGAKGHKVDSGSGKKCSAAFVAADHYNFVSEPFPLQIANIVTPRIKIGKS